MVQIMPSGLHPSCQRGRSGHFTPSLTLSFSPPLVSSVTSPQKAGGRGGLGDRLEGEEGWGPEVREEEERE